MIARVQFQVYWQRKRNVEKVSTNKNCNRKDEDKYTEKYLTSHVFFPIRALPT